MFEEQIQTIMTKTLISVNRSTTVHQIAKMMEQGGIGAIIVKDQNPVGIITDRDYAIKIVANNLEHNTSVERVMSSPLITISATESILAAAKLMTAKKIRKTCCNSKWYNSGYSHIYRYCNLFGTMF